MKNRQDESRNPSSQEFEEFVAAALKVDPKGLSGKHRKRDDPQSEQGPDCGTAP